jgi:hypothetical protein
MIMELENALNNEKDSFLKALEITDWIAVEEPFCRKIIQT